MSNIKKLSCMRTEPTTSVAMSFSVMEIQNISPRDVIQRD